MKIQTIRIQNFRGFCDETITLNDYTCLVGRNGSGKSTVLYALNLFFRQYKDTATDLSRLTEDDFHHKRTDLPIRITVTFGDLSPEARADLKDYVRQDLLTITAQAEYDRATRRALVTQHGSRLGVQAFRKYFEADKDGAKADQLRAIFDGIRDQHDGVAAATTKPNMVAALNQYEAEHPEGCVLIESEDQFYGASRGSNRLAPHVQWVFVPATKDYSDEANESKDSALGQLLARTVRSKTDFSPRISEMRTQAQQHYDSMLQEEQHVLDELSASLQARLQSWAHPAVTAQVRWNSDSVSAIKIEEPGAAVRLGERGFSGDLPRFGHGLQRSYLLGLLQELSTVEAEAGPTLIMAIEEPELYQHPPQARHLAEVLRELSVSGSQVLCCSHSPLFIPGSDFEAVRVVRDDGQPCETSVTGTTYVRISERLEAAGDKLLREEGMLAKLYPTLNPVVNEMFFCSRLVLVEGAEDVSHLMAYIELTGHSDAFRELGCHIVPVGGKCNLLRPLAVAKELGIPVFVVWDADTDNSNADQILKHKKDNRALQMLLGVESPDEWPAGHIRGDDFFVWQDNLTSGIQAELGDGWTQARQEAEARYGQPGGLAKNPLAIAHAHAVAWPAGHRSDELQSLVGAIIEWASQ